MRTTKAATEHAANWVPRNYGNWGARQCGARLGLAPARKMLHSSNAARAVEYLRDNHLNA